MAVNVGQRNVPDTPANRQLIACEKAMELCLHTIKICKNKKTYYKNLAERNNKNEDREIRNFA